MQLHLGFRNETFDEISAAMRAGVRYLSFCGSLIGDWTAAGYPQGRGLSAAG
jgi:hypothetical protein